MCVYMCVCVCLCIYINIYICIYLCILHYCIYQFRELLQCEIIIILSLINFKIKTSSSETFLYEHIKKGL